VAPEIAALIEAGNDALKTPDWLAAEQCFRAALELGETGEALFGLGIARWWVGDTRDALRCWEGAYAAFSRVPDPGQAVLTSVYLCLAYRMSLGSDAVAHGWLARAASLVEEFGLTPMKGWVLLCRAHIANDDRQPRHAERHARAALALAREGRDADLTLCATCELGAAQVELGRLEEGAALLDQAMAAALAGEAGDFDTVVLVSCRTVASCARAADIKRAIQWIRAADDFHRRYGSTHLYTTCRVHHASVLFAVGEWDRAEGELEAALRIGRHAEPALHAEALAKLAELRIAQGRIDEAARLLGGQEDQATTAYACALLQLASGSPGAAADLVRRRLREIDQDGLEAAALVDLLAEAEVARGHQGDVARPVAARPGGDAPCRLVAALTDRASGRALAAVGDAVAIEHLERALAGFGALEMPYECARVRHLIAHVMAGTQPETAIVEARAALAAFETLGAARDADACAALLRSIGVKAGRAGPKRAGQLTKRELEVLRLLAEGLSNPEIAARLFLSRKTVEHHVANVLTKLGLSSRGQAAAYAMRHLDRSSGSK
jgi:DNA-binding CsgD family transcriptional regulator/predicted negative regulator of RcsB-dependent stress response